MSLRNRRAPALLAVASGLAAVAVVIGARAGAQEAPPEVQRAASKLVEYQTKEARTALQPAAARADSDGAIAVALGRVLEQEKKYDEAASTLIRAATLLPGDPAPQVFLGETYIHAKRYGDAEKAFSTALQLGQGAVEKNPNSGAAWYYLGVAQQRSKQYEKAFASLARAKDNGFDGALVLFQQGVTRLMDNKPQEAVDLLTASVAQNSGIAYAYYYRGLAQDKLGKKDQLVLDMDRFFKVAPQAPEAEKAQAIVKAAKR